MKISGKKVSFTKLPLLWSIKGEGEFQELTDLKNIIVVGAQSTGKTNFVNQLIVSILFSKNPLTVRLIIADIKGLEYAQYAQLSTNFLTSLAGETDIISREISSVVARINALCIEMDNRYQLYENSDNEVKRQIIGSIFPEKMVFDGQSYRTTRVNEAVGLVWAMGAGFSENKNGQTDSTIDLSTLVTPAGDFSNQLVEDLKRIARLTESKSYSR